MNKTLITSSNYKSYTVTKTGDGASGTWGIDITGNANTATSAVTATSATTATSANTAATANAANITSNKYGIAYYTDAAGTFGSTATGTSGQLLQSGGSSATPSWITATDSNTASTIVKRDSSGGF